MLISGKMSVGVRSSTTGVSKITTSAITMNVYGLASAKRTIHILSASLLGEFWRHAALRDCQACFGKSIRFLLDSSRRQFGYVAAPGSALPVNLRSLIG